MNVDLLPNYYWDIRTPADGHPGPTYLAIMKDGVDGPHPYRKVTLPEYPTNHYYAVVEAMEELAGYHPELFDQNAKKANKYRAVLAEVIDHFSSEN